MFDFKITEDSSAEEVTGGLYDIVIIGGGPAGLTAAIYAGRDGQKTLVLDKEATGGLATTTERIDNYPGFPDGISGMDLMDNIRRQAERFGTEIAEFEEVVKVNSLRKDAIEVTTEDGTVYQGKTVVIATGSRPNKLNIPGEDEYSGKGVSYCATCDGPFFKGKDIIMIGAGNAGLQEGLQVMGYVNSMTVLVHSKVMRAEQILQDRIRNHEKSRLVYNQEPIEIKGENTVTGVIAEDRETGERKFFPGDGIFIYIGYSPDTKFVADLVDLDPWGYIITDNHMRTNVPGLYAVGDVRADNPAQMTISVGDGAKAALAIREYLQDLK